MIRDKHGYRYQSHTFRNPPRGRSGTVTSPGAGAGTGLCRVHRPAVGQTGRDIAGGKQAPAGTGSGSDRTGKYLTRAELRSLLRRLNTNSGNSGIPSSKDPPWYTDNQGNAGTQTGNDDSSPATTNGEEEKKKGEESEDSKDPKDPKDPKGSGKKTGARKGHTGARQEFVTPDEELKFFPGPCSCGCHEIGNLEPFYRQQYFEIPTILVKVSHIILYRGSCSNWGKVCKGKVPQKFQVGYGPNLSALVQGLITLGLSR